MKKKIIIALSVFFLIFILSSVYIITNIESATATLNTLIKLHRIEITREQLLIEIKRAQSDLYLKNTRYARTMDTVVAHVLVMTSVVNECFNCHHTETVNKQLENFRERIEQYKNALSRVFTIRANQRRLEAEENNAFKIGTDLIDEVDAVTRMTSQKLAERTDTALKDIARTKRILFLLLAAVPLITLGLSIVFLQRFTGPVDKLLTATRRLKSGELEYRIQGLQDEYGEVAASFNEMASSLREHYLRMQWAEQILVLSELAGGLAHEMRNPLAGIKSSMEVMLGDPSNVPNNREIIVEVIEQVRRIEITLKSLFNFARPSKPKFIAVNMNDVLNATVALAQRHPLFIPSESKKIIVVKEFDANLPEVMADPVQLQQAIINLLLNAADAMNEGGSITLKTSLNERARSLCVIIMDTGKGIDSSVIGKIFLPFFTTKAKGTGLGLAITKRLLEQHGGSITVDSTAGSGATFTLTLPLERHEEVQLL